MAKKKRKNDNSLKVVKTPEDHQKRNEPESIKPDEGAKDLPTKEDILGAQEQAIDAVMREKLINYAHKIKILTKGKWFTLFKFQQLMKIPQAQSAQILLAMFNQKLVAIDNDIHSKPKYKVDFDKSVQLHVIEKTIKRHKRSIADLTKEKHQLIAEQEADKKEIEAKMSSQ